jgi:hypothetical protein
MRRMLIACLTCVPLAVVGFAPAAASAAPGDHVTGAGLLSPYEPGEFVNMFAFGLSSKADGSNPVGTANVIGFIGSGADKTKHSFNGDPVCLRVEANRATFVLDFRVTKGIGDIAGAQFWVVDNGNALNPFAPVDSVVNDRLSEAPLEQATCDSTVPPRTRVIAKGDVTVRDN